MKAKVRLGIVGIGGRGSHALESCLSMKDVEVPALCDIVEENLLRAKKAVEDSGRPAPETYADYRDLVSRDDIDGVLVITGWRDQTPVSIAAMEAGKYVAPECGGSATVEECWDLVRAHEKTGMPCMMLENHCFNRDMMALLRMVREGVFGELIHCQGGYQHDLRRRIVLGKGSNPAEKELGDFRTRENEMRNGDLYPTHGVGPLAELLNINRGNRFLTLSSFATKARGLSDWARENLDPDHPGRNRSWKNGDIVTTVITCNNGETVVLNHDVALPRPKSNMRRVQGTKAIWMEDNDSIHVEGRSPEHEWEEFAAYQEEFEHPLWKKYLEVGVRSSHLGVDYLKHRIFVECIKREIPTPIDAYDTATWRAITALSEQSVARGGAPVDFPDFTHGAWMTNEPILGTTEFDLE